MSAAIAGPRMMAVWLIVWNSARRNVKVLEEHIIDVTRWGRKCIMASREGKPG